MNEMPVFVINLPQCVDRKHNMEIQLKKLGLPYKFIEAVDGKALSSEEKNTLCDFKKIYKRYHRMLSDGEIGCVLSHKKVYDYMIKNNIPKAIILEDDAILKNNFIDCYNELLNFDKDNFLIKLNIDEAEGKNLSLFGRVNLHNFSLKKRSF